MSFENPTYLWGMFAALLPLVLHLIARRRARVHEFAAMEFILASNKRIARRLRLRQVVLLLLRMLLLAVIPFAFAKPFSVVGEEGLPATGVPASVVLVIDPSFSMGYLVEKDTLLDLAKERAKAIIADLRNESDATVVVAGSSATALSQTLTYDRRHLTEAVDRISLEHGSADMQGALRLAEQILATSSQRRRDVVLLTDLQASEWEGITRPWSLEHSPSVTIVDLRPRVERANVAVTRVDVSPEFGGLGQDVRITVEILNERPTPFDDVVTVRLADQTAKAVVKVPPHQSAQKDFTVHLEEVGSVRGFVEIPPDALPGDNVHPFVVDFLRRVHVLIVNGSPRSVPYRDETFFLRVALRPGPELGSRINATYVKPDELTQAQLRHVDVVFLANVGELDVSQVAALASWVENGGGLFVSAGENVTPEVYNGPMRVFSPLPIRDIKDAGEAAFYFTAAETNHPVLEVFAHMPDASLFSARIQRYVLFDTAAGADARVLCSYTDGSPALVERTVGAGRVLMLTTTIDRDWTDLPVKTSYLPLVQQAVLYLSGKLGQPEQHNLIVGGTMELVVGRDVSKLTVTRPDGQTLTYDGPDLAAGELRFRESDTAGIYELRRHRNQGADEEAFAVHLDPAESMLRGADRNAVEVLLESGRRDAVAAATPGGKPVKGELWPFLLISLFVLLGLETWLAFAKG